MKFWDTSALVPLFLDHPTSAQLRTLGASDDAIVVWWGTRVECHSVLARLSREGVLDTPREAEARNVLAHLVEAWVEVEPSERLRAGATLLLDRRALRAADALQLTAALIWAQAGPRDHAFVCLDRRLREAARGEGFQVLPAQPRS